MKFIVENLRLIIRRHNIDDVFASIEEARNFR